jgi:6-phosphogluconolactonase
VTNKIDTFTVASGVATGPNVQNSSGTTPFGFAFSASGKLIVSEAVMATANAGTVSSYSIAPNGTLTPVANKVTLGQSAPCWVAVSGTNAYVTNAGSNNVSALKVATDGNLTLVGTGNNGMTGMGPTDLAVTDDNQYLYTLNARDHSFTVFSIAADGMLTKKNDVQGAPMNAVGLVAR